MAPKSAREKEKGEAAGPFFMSPVRALFTAAILLLVIGVFTHRRAISRVMSGKEPLESLFTGGSSSSGAAAAKAAASAPTLRKKPNCGLTPQWPDNAKHCKKEQGEI
jgi:FkbM family methyltransferase